MSAVDRPEEMGRPAGKGALGAVYADDTLRHVAYTMVEAGATEMQVRERDLERVVGHVTLEQLLQARLRDLQEERHSERVLKPRELIGWAPAPRAEP